MLNLSEEKKVEREKEERREGEERKTGREAKSRDKTNWRRGTLNHSCGVQSKSEEALQRLHEVLK